MPSTGTLVFNDQKLQAPEMYATESLGVGVSVPTSNLEVTGNAYVSSNLDVGGSLGLTKGSSLFVGDSVMMETSKHDRPIVKYPEIAMTANSSGGYVVSASGTPNVNHSPYHAFNNSAGNTSDSWHSENSYTTSGSRESTTSTLSTWTGGGGGHNGAWLKIQLPNKIVLNHIRLKQRTAVSGLQHPRLFSIVGSNDDSNWYLVHEETSRTFTGATAPNIDHYTMSGPYASTAWKYFAIVIRTGATDNSYSHVAIGDWELHGTEEGDVSTDVTLSSALNKPGTQQLEVYWDGADSNSYSGSGTTVNDLSGNSVTGTLVNGVGFDSEYNAFTFDGSNDYISGSLATTTGAWVHSFSFWMNADTAGVGHFVALGAESTNNASVIRFNSQDVFQWYFWGNDLRFNAPNTLQRWVHVVGTYDGGNDSGVSAGNYGVSRKIFIDGKETTVSENVSGTAGTNPLNLATATTPFRVGSQLSGTAYFDGKIANVRVFSKKLSIDQIRELYEYDAARFGHRTNVVSLHKGNLGIGVNYPNSRFEVASADGVFEYPPQAMTGNETYMEGGVFRVSASSEYGPGGRDAWYAFDNSTGGWQQDGNSWDTNGTNYIGSASFEGAYGEFIQLELPHPIKPKQMKLVASVTNRMITDGILFGRDANDGTWHAIHTLTGYTTWSYNIPQYIDINATEYYDAFTLLTQKMNGHTNVHIGGIKFFGMPAPSTLDDGHMTLEKQLTTPRVSGHAAGAETPRAESLVVHYDTTVDSVVTGTTVVDTSGNGINSAMENGLVYSSNERALVFDGTNDRTYISSVKNGSGAWVHSMSLWCKSNSAANSSDDTFAFIGEKSSYKCIGLEIQGNENFRYYFWSSDADTPTGSFTRGVWHHVVVTYDGGSSTTSKSVYIDGVKQTLTQSAGTTALNLNANDEFLLGSQQGGSKPLNGSISNFKMWNVALTADDVAAEYALGRTGKALNVTDTAVCLGGSVPRAKFDVRGIATVDRLNIVERLDVNTIARLNHYAGSRSGTFSGSGTFDLPANLDYGWAAAPKIGWEIHMAFGFSGTAGGEFFIAGAKDTSGTNVSANESSHFSIEPNGSTNYGGTCYLTYSGEPVAPVYYAKITIAQPYFNNVPASSNGSVHRIHIMSDCVGCKRNTGASLYRGACYVRFSSSGRRIKYLRLNCTAGTVSGNYMVNALTSEL